jgi:hypothetical protein
METQTHKTTSTQGQFDLSALRTGLPGHAIIYIYLSLYVTDKVAIANTGRINSVRVAIVIHREHLGKHPFPGCGAKQSSQRSAGRPPVVFILQCRDLMLLRYEARRLYNFFVSLSLRLN